MHDRDLLENPANLPENWTGNVLGDAWLAGISGLLYRVKACHRIQ